MKDYKWLARLGGEGYAKVVAKINNFYDSSIGFPKTANEMDSEFPLTKTELNALEHRGKLERKLNEIQKPKLLLVRTHDKEDDEYLSNDNQIIFTYFGYKLDNFTEKDNVNLGLFLINNDIGHRKKKHIPRGFGTNARMMYLRPKHKNQLIFPICGGDNSNNVGALILPFYQLEEVCCSPEEILEHCKKQKLTEINMERMENLVSNATQSFFSEMSNSVISKKGITIPEEVKIVYSEFGGGRRSFKERFGISA